MQLLVKDVSALLDIPEKTIYRWISRREIPAHRVNDGYRFSRDELLDWATERKLDVSKLLSVADESAGLPTLVNALEAGGIHHGIEGADKRSVLQAMVTRLPIPEDADRAVLLELLLAREALASTGVGEGIAIPHARKPIVLDVAEASVAVGFLAKPVDFGAIDGQPVSCLFLLLSPTARVHLHLLSQLAHALQYQAFRDAVRRTAPREELLDAARQVLPAMAKGP